MPPQQASRQPLAPEQAALHARQLLRAALAQLLRGAQEGDVPLFAWTLGLSQSDLCELVRSCFPESGPLQPLPAADYAVLQRLVPPELEQWVAHMLPHRNPQADVREAQWLAHAVATAGICGGSLWQNLGLQGHDALGFLLQHYYPSLYARNVRQAPWTHFLAQELQVPLA